MDSSRPAPQQDPLSAALASMIGPIVKAAVADAWAEHAEGASPKPELVTEQEAARAVNVSVATLRRALPDVPHIYVGEHRRYRVSSVVEFFEARSRQRREVSR